MSMEKVGIRTLLHRLCQYSNSIYACPNSLVDEILSYFCINQNEKENENEDKLIFYIPRTLSEKNFSGLISIGGQGSIIKCRMEKIVKNTIIEKNIAFKIAKPVLSSRINQNSNKSNDYESFLTIPDARFVESSQLQSLLENDLEDESEKKEINFRIPHVYCFGEKPVPFLGMSWVESLDIIHILSDKNDIVYSIEMFLKVLEAAKFLHYHNIVYRDFKAKNLKVAYNDKIVVLDFGLAKSMEARNITVSGKTMLGTLPYASHKICNGYADSANHLDDIHALGYTFWEFLTHKECPVLSSESNREKYRLERSKDIPTLCKNIFFKATDNDEDKRFQLVEEFEEAIKNLLSKIRENKKEDFTPTIIEQKVNFREEKRMKGLTNRFLPVSFGQPKPQEDVGQKKQEVVGQPKPQEDDPPQKDDPQIYKKILAEYRQSILKENCKNCKYPDCQGRGICQKIEIAFIDILEKIFLE